MPLKYSYRDNLKRDNSHIVIQLLLARSWKRPAMRDERLRIATLNATRRDYGFLATKNLILESKLAVLRSQPNLEAKGKIQNQASTNPKRNT